MLKDHSLAPSAPKPKIDLLEGLDDDGLLALRNRIDSRLNLDISALNLADELGAQYRAGKALLASLLDAGDTPANQHAQVYNSVGAMLDKILKQQKIVYSAERLKRFESAFLRVLQDLPEESKRKFFDLYADYLKETPNAHQP